MLRSFRKNVTEIHGWKHLFRERFLPINLNVKVGRPIIMVSLGGRAPPIRTCPPHLCMSPPPPPIFAFPPNSGPPFSNPSLLYLPQIDEFNLVFTGCMHGHNRARVELEEIQLCYVKLSFCSLFLT